VKTRRIKPEDVKEGLVYWLCRRDKATNSYIPHEQRSVVSVEDIGGQAFVIQKDATSGKDRSPVKLRSFLNHEYYLIEVPDQREAVMEQVSGFLGSEQASRDEALRLLRSIDTTLKAVGSMLGIRA